MKNSMSFTAAALLALAACSDNTGPTMGGGVSLSFATDVTAGAAAAPSFFGGPSMVGTVNDGANELIMESVLIVLREIELERVEVTDCDVEPEPDGCEKFETGPVLIDLPLDGRLSSDEITITDITPGVYDEVEFDIHVVTGNDDVTAFAGMDGKSIVVTGTYNGTPFTYDSDLNEEQELSIDLTIDEDGVVSSTNVTIEVDVSTWFVDAGGNLFDPATANEGGVNENLAETNIRDSFKAFEDEDKDGDDDSISP
jgi:hypothetical protein